MLSYKEFCAALRESRGQDINLRRDNRPYDSQNDILVQNKEKRDALYASHKRIRELDAIVKPAFDAVKETKMLLKGHYNEVRLFLDGEYYNESDYPLKEDSLENISLEGSFIEINLKNYSGFRGLEKLCSHLDGCNFDNFDIQIRFDDNFNRNVNQIANFFKKINNSYKDDLVFVLAGHKVEFKDENEKKADGDIYFTYEEAVERFDKPDKDGWRLPTREELGALWYFPYKYDSENEQGIIDGRLYLPAEGSYHISIVGPAYNYFESHKGQYLSSDKGKILAFDSEDIGLDSVHHDVEYTVRLVRDVN